MGAGNFVKASATSAAPLLVSGCALETGIDPMLASLFVRPVEERFPARVDGGTAVFEWSSALDEGLLSRVNEPPCLVDELPEAVGLVELLETLKSTEEPIMPVEEFPKPVCTEDVPATVDAPLGAL